jgi:hypothetical protein
MDNKIILELIKKNLEEINLLVEDLCKGGNMIRFLLKLLWLKLKFLPGVVLVKPDMQSDITPLMKKSG